MELFQILMVNSNCKNDDLSLVVVAHVELLGMWKIINNRNSSQQQQQQQQQQQ